MMPAYTIRLHPEADKEFIQAYAWYEDKEDGLGEKFIAAVRAKLVAITNNPEAFGSRDHSSFREALTDIFPYLIVYKIYPQKGEVFISSIYHAKRHLKNKYRKG